MARDSQYPHVGIRAYALAGIALGILGLVSRDFAAVWQPLENLGLGAHRQLAAIIYAAGFLTGGIAAFWPKTSRLALLLLAALHLIAAAGWVPRIIGLPHIYGTWNGFFELLLLAAAGVVGYATLLTNDSGKRIVAAGRVVAGLCAISFGVSHFTAMAETAGMVPKWIPPTAQFWAGLTGVLYVLAGAALITNVRAMLAARLLALMMFGFGVLVWVPMLYAKPVHFMWAGTVITIALAAAMWVVADALAALAGEHRYQESRRGVLT